MPRSSSSPSPSPPPSHRRSYSRRRRSPSPSRSRSRSRSRSHSRSRARTSTKHSSSARSKSTDSHSDKKGAVLKTSLVFLGSIAAATYAAHKFWPKGVIHGEREEWEVAQEVKHVHKRRARSRGEYRDDGHRNKEVETYRPEQARWKEVQVQDDRDIPGRITGGKGLPMRRGEDEYRREPSALVERTRERWEDEAEYERGSVHRPSRYVEEEWSSPRPRLEARRDDRFYPEERPRQVEYDQAYGRERSGARRTSADWERDRSHRW